MAFAMRSQVFVARRPASECRLIFGEIKDSGDARIEITSTGQTTYENGLATARDDVAIHIGNTDISPTTHGPIPPRMTVELRGHVRIYRDASLYRCRQRNLQH